MLQDKWRGVVIIAILAAQQIPSLFYSDLHSYPLGQAYVYVFIGAIAGLYDQPRSVSALATVSQRPQSIHTA
jgi:hypothetical protein